MLFSKWEELYDLTLMWNLMNEIIWGTKQNQRHGYMEQTDRSQRGWWRGGLEEISQRMYRQVSTAHGHRQQCGKGGGWGGLGRGLTSRIVPTIKNKVRQTDSYNLENPRTSTFPKLTHVNQAIVPGDPWLRWEHSSGFTLSCCHWSSRHFSHFNDSLLLEQKRQPKNAFLFVFKHQIILMFFSFHKGYFNQGVS